jgi:phosphatidylinositol alpha-1,6-mannosyltransferase
MGLDLTFENPVYRALVHPVIRRTPTVIAISAATSRVAEDLGVPAERLHVIRLGVAQPPSIQRMEAAQALRKMIGAEPSAITVLTLGRLVRRKGVRWFVDEVLPGLPATVHYVVAGSGPEWSAVRRTAASRGLEERVHLLGQVDDATRDMLLAGADVFVQPNIPVPGDMEGFGLVTIEAALRGTPVVAADLEGIKDAVIDGQTGMLLPPGDGEVWAEVVRELVRDRTRLQAMGARFRQMATDLYSETAMGEQLAAILGLGESA